MRRKRKRPELPDGYAVFYNYSQVMSKRPVPLPLRKMSDTDQYRTKTVARMRRYAEECVPTVCTTARVYREDDPERAVVATGEALLNPRDQFSRRIGRDIALGRAVKRLGSGRDMLT